MAATKYYEGQEFVSDDPAKPALVYRGGKFYPKSGEPGAATTADDMPAAPLTPGSDSRTRVVIGLGPAIEGQKQMYKSEGWGTNPKDPSGLRGGINPFNKDWGAKSLSLSAENGKPNIFGIIDKQALARKIGGVDYQQYTQAAKSWEAAVLPVLSGAAVTPSEASRQIQAQLPELGDDPRLLATKAKNRAMMTNAAADLAGKPRPFPQVGTWDFKGQNGSGSVKPAGQQVVKVNTPEDAMKLAPGTVFVTPDGRRKVR